MTEIAVIFDASALLAYVSGALAPGELLVEVSDEGRRVGIPTTCLVEARASCPDDSSIGQLMMLAALPTISMLPLGTVDGDHLTDLMRIGKLARTINGDVASAHAVQEAIRHRAHFATTRVKEAAQVLPGGWSILDLTT